MARYVEVLLDNTGEKSNATYPGVELTAGNIAAQLALMAALTAARAGITEGTLYKDYVITEEDPGSSAPPVALTAQREKKWLVTYADSVGGLHRLEIPTADESLLVSGTDLMDVSGGAGAAFVTAFEDYVAIGGNPVTFVRAQMVYRNI